MIWESWDAFFSMGGYALYVWGSVAVVAVFIAGEIVEVRLRRKNILLDLSIAKSIREQSVRGRQ
ncbi:MAG TPA: heme exporter protein CcmD [Herminiimonas sp.]|nr:heme exporter protein CcmD [Herminiimonas sp.]